MKAMGKEVKRIWTFNGEMRGNARRTYETIQYSDDTLSCDCAGWCRRVDHDGKRSCKHTRMVLAGVADAQAVSVRF